MLFGIVQIPFLPGVQHFIRAETPLLLVDATVACDLVIAQDVMDLQGLDV